MLNIQTKIKFNVRMEFIANTYEGLFLESITFINISYFLKKGDFLKPAIEDTCDPLSSILTIF